MTVKIPRRFLPARDRGPLGLGVNMRESTAPRLDRCTVQLHRGDFCNLPGMKDAPFPMCPRHIRQAFEFGYQLVGNAQRPVPNWGPYRLGIAETFSEFGDRNRRLKEDGQKFLDDRPCVYFIQIGEFIKIGATTNFPRRVLSYPPNRKILHVQYAEDCWTIEAQYLRKFQDHLTGGREWFSHAPEILAFIEGLKCVGALQP